MVINHGVTEKILDGQPRAGWISQQKTKGEIAMKKSIIITLIICAMLLALLSASTVSAKPFWAVIAVRNQTGVPITAILQNPSGTATYVFPVGAVDISILAGQYKYYAKTVCGLQYGTVNLSRMAVLHFSCVQGEQVKASRPNNR